MTDQSIIAGRRRRIHSSASGTNVGGSCPDRCGHARRLVRRAAQQTSGY
jgi:hypothetical protein